VNPTVFVTRDRTGKDTFLPIRYADPDADIYVPADMWKTNQTRLEHVHTFIVTREPRVWHAQGYVDFEGLMYPPVDEEPSPPWGRLSWHGLKIYRYFVGVQHFGDGSIWEMR